ncbi:hypothetical protein F0U62_16240 [Cystobacter fuscus]|uniref:PH domain-containing protein n=1 Tax=Cystobacter fuscus TaxID=43 RepID=UPI002B30CB2D|nr:hypothetical protein F0U62_16240 [Cystobacter fuscus]
MHVYQMAPHGSRGVLWVIFVTLLLVLVLLLLALRAPKFEASNEGLRIRGSPFGREIPAAALRLESARIVNLRESPDLAPKWRTMGVGLPGYRAGWFRLQNGEKALVFLGRGEEALYIPTSEGYALLIAPEDLAGCLRTLKGNPA